jgi:hypothetical protein
MHTLVKEDHHDLPASFRETGTSDRPGDPLTKRGSQHRRATAITAACIAFLVVVPTSLVVALTATGTGGGAPTSTPACVQAGYPANIKTCHVK